jgi:hypothetical protein
LAGFGGREAAPRISFSVAAAGIAWRRNRTMNNHPKMTYNL